MLISEIYQSRQGEGLLTGTPSVFVRTSGCNLRCDFCDTPFASWEPTGEALSIDEIVQRVVVSADQADEVTKHVVLTGGEPMLPREIETLCERLHDLKFHLTIETAGTIYRELDCDLMSVSPKFANSTPSESRGGVWTLKHEQSRFRPAIVQRLMDRYDYQLKFVVDQQSDIAEIVEYMTLFQIEDLSRVMLMPQGVEQAVLEEKEQWLRPICQQHRFTFCPRQHIQWYGNRRGT